MTDFERAAINASRNALGQNVNLSGCDFHITSNMWKHVQKLRLVRLYFDDKNVKLFVRIIAALSFLPLNDVPGGYELVQEHIPNPALAPLLHYFGENYVIGRLQIPVQQRAPPPFPPETWNVHAVTLAGGRRTNNICEGWNSAFTKLVGESHPSLFKLLTCLQKDNVMVSTRFQQSEVGISFVCPVRGISYPFHTICKWGICDK